VVAVTVTTQPAFQAAKPTIVFEKPYWARRYQPGYDVSADGRFVMVKENEQVAAAKTVNVVLGWFDELRRKAPARP